MAGSGPWNCLALQMPTWKKRTFSRLDVSTFLGEHGSLTPTTVEKRSRTNLRYGERSEPQIGGV